MIPNLLGLAGDLVLVVWLATAAFWAVAGLAVASWLGRPRTLGLVLGATLPVVGPLGLAVVSGARRVTRRGRRGPGTLRHGRPPAAVRFLAAGTALALAAAVAVLTGIRDTELAVGTEHRLLFSVRDLGLTTPVLLTLVLLLGAAAVCCWRTSRWAAIAVAWCGSWWLLWTLAALVVGETLEVLAGAADLPGSLTAVAQVGPSWTWLLGTAVLLLAWSGAVLVLPGAQGVAAGGGAAPPPGVLAAAPGRGALDPPVWSVPEPRPGPDAFVPVGQERRPSSP